MGNKPSIITTDNISGVVNDSFGFWRPSQIILYERNLEGDYKALTDYLMRMQNVTDTEEKRVSLEHLNIASKDLSLSEEGRQAALQVWEDFAYMREATDNVDLFVQGGQMNNSTTEWHRHGYSVERTILCKYNGAATEIVKNEDVASWGRFNDPNGFFVACDIKEDAEPITFDNGHIFAITGAAAHFLGKGAVHRRPPSDGEPTLVLLAEPDV